MAKSKQVKPNLIPKVWKEAPRLTGKERDDAREWYMKTDKRSFVKVWKTGLSSGERKKRGIGLWLVSTPRNKHSFKSKIPAYKYAKEYMWFRS